MLLRCAEGGFRLLPFLLPPPEVAFELVASHVGRLSPLNSLDLQQSLLAATGQGVDDGDLPAHFEALRVDLLRLAHFLYRLVVVLYRHQRPGKAQERSQRVRLGCHQLAEGADRQCGIARRLLNLPQQLERSRIVWQGGIRFLRRQQRLLAIAPSGVERDERDPRIDRLWICRHRLLEQ